MKANPAEWNWIMWMVFALCIAIPVYVKFGLAGSSRLRGMTTAILPAGKTAGKWLTKNKRIKAALPWVLGGVFGPPFVTLLLWFLLPGWIENVLTISPWGAWWTISILVGLAALADPRLTMTAACVLGLPWFYMFWFSPGYGSHAGLMAIAAQEVLVYKPAPDCRLSHIPHDGVIRGGDVCVDIAAGRKLVVVPPAGFKNTISPRNGAFRISYYGQRQNSMADCAKEGKTCAEVEPGVVRLYLSGKDLRVTSESGETGPVRHPTGYIAMIIQTEGGETARIRSRSVNPAG